MNNFQTKQDKFSLGDLYDLNKLYNLNDLIMKEISTQRHLKNSDDTICQNGIKFIRLKCDKFSTEMLGDSSPGSSNHTSQEISDKFIIRFTYNYKFFSHRLRSQTETSTSRPLQEKSSYLGSRKKPL